MTPVEELREAARLMRERAQAATPGPWGVIWNTCVASEAQARTLVRQWAKQHAKTLGVQVREDGTR